MSRDPPLWKHQHPAEDEVFDHVSELDKVIGRVGEGEGACSVVGLGQWDRLVPLTKGPDLVGHLEDKVSASMKRIVCYYWGL